MVDLIALRDELAKQRFGGEMTVDGGILTVYTDNARLFEVHNNGRFHVNRALLKGYWPKALDIIKRYVEGAN